MTMTRSNTELYHWKQQCVIVFFVFTAAWPWCYEICLSALECVVRTQFGLRFFEGFLQLKHTTCSSPGERLELSEVGPASSLRLSSTPSWALPPCWGLGCCSPSRVPEVCCPAWTWKQDTTHRPLWRAVHVFTWHSAVIYESCCAFIYLYLMCSAQSPRPHQIQIRGPALCLRSPCCSWSCPLRFGRPRTWKSEWQWIYMEERWKG